GPLDPEVMDSPIAWAERAAHGRTGPRSDPNEVSHELAWFSLRVRGDAATIDDLKPRSPVEWARIRDECLALAQLADHYADRISAASHLALHLATHDEMELTLAESRLNEARLAWAELAKLTGS